MICNWLSFCCSFQAWKENDRKEVFPVKLTISELYPSLKTPSRLLLPPKKLIFYYLQTPPTHTNTDRKTGQAREEFTDNKLVQFALWQNSGSLWLSLINLYGIEPPSTAGLMHRGMIFVFVLYACVHVCGLRENPSNFRYHSSRLCLLQSHHTHAHPWAVFPTCIHSTLHTHTHLPQHWQA